MKKVTSPPFPITSKPCVDFFFHVVPDTPAHTLTDHLRLAWDHNPLTALKLICNLRGVRGTGKADKEGYYTAALWLHKHHPRTLACNVGPMADFGYFKDLPEILFRLLEGADVRRKAKEEHLSRWRTVGWPPTRFTIGYWRIMFTLGWRRFITTGFRELRGLMLEAEKENASKQREERRFAMAKKVIEKYMCDPDFRFLYECISDLFSDLLKLDMKFLRDGELRKISLAAKWCPSLNSSFDKSTLLCESIAKKIFDRKSYPEYEGVEEAHYAFRVRDRLRKEVLVPLRAVLQLPEVFIGVNDWGSIPYNRVASVAMVIYKDKFLKHDKLRFEEYLEKVKAGKATTAAGALLSHQKRMYKEKLLKHDKLGFEVYLEKGKAGKATIAAGALLPHQIMASLYDRDGGEVAELQWKRMVEDLAKKGKLKNCLAISDISWSMMGIPLEVSVALGILVSELSEEPWKGKLVTFSANPKLHIIQGQDLRSKAVFLIQVEWTWSADFQKVFDIILQVAIDGNLREEQMIKRVFVFSDMEFDRASGNSWETDYEAIVRKFTAEGYGSAVPEIVFWNLRNSKGTPVQCNYQPGVSLISGFSKNLLTLFLEDSGGLNPESVMDAAINGDEYKKLVVVD